MQNIDVAALSAAIAQAVTTAVVATLSEAQPAVVTAPAPQKAPAAPRKAQGKALTKETRKAFVAAALNQSKADFRNCSTKAIAAMCVENPALVPAGFRIGAGYSAMFAA